jgi:hypothetical protein
MNFQTVHYVLVSCAALAAGLPNLEPALPLSATPWLKGATAVLMLLTGVLGALSPSAGAKS